MKRSEIQKRLKDIIANTHQVIERLKSMQSWFEEMKLKLDDLEQHVALQGKDLLNKENVLKDIYCVFFEQEVEDLAILTDELKIDLDSYAMRLGEKNEQQVYDQYGKIEDALLLMDAGNHTDIAKVIENLQQSITILEEIHN